MGRREDREEAFSLVFEDTFFEQDLNKIFKLKNNVSFFAKQVFKGIKNNKEKIEKIIEENIINWNKDRLSKVAVSVLRVAIYEILFESSIEINISINEAVEICKKYGAKGDAPFVNAVLAKIVSKKEQNK